MKIIPNGDRVRIKLVDPRVEKTEGGLFIPNVAQVEPKVFEATVLEHGMEAQKYKPGTRVLIPARILGDRLTDGTVFVKESEIFGEVQDSLLVEAGGLLVAK